LTHAKQISSSWHSESSLPRGVFHLHFRRERKAILKPSRRMSANYFLKGKIEKTSLLSCNESYSQFHGQSEVLDPLKSIEVKLWRKFAFRSESSSEWHDQNKVLQLAKPIQFKIRKTSLLLDILLQNDWNPEYGPPAGQQIRSLLARQFRVTDTSTLAISHLRDRTRKTKMGKLIP
jgi:hypothetical protein